MEELLVQPPIMLTLLEYLSPIEYLVLRMCSRVFSDHPNTYPSFYDFVLRRVKHNLVRWFHPNDASIVDIVWDYLNDNPDVMLSGGFMLHTLTGEAVSTKQDIDFYVPDSSALLRKPLWTNLAALAPRAFDVTLVNANEFYPFGGRMEVSTIFFRADWKFQFVRVDGTALECIDQFDFSFCSNGFSATQCTIKDLNAIITRSCIVPATRYTKVPTGYPVMAKRLRKYGKRGYDILVRFDPALTHGSLAAEDDDYDRDGFTRKWNDVLSNRMLEHVRDDLYRYAPLKYVRE